jgi:hypothetical protein
MQKVCRISFRNYRLIVWKADEWLPRGYSAHTLNVSSAEEMQMYELGLKPRKSWVFQFGYWTITLVRKY